LGEGVGADEARDGAFEAEFFAEFAQRGLFGALAALDEAGHEAEPALGPAALAGEQDGALVLDHGGDDGQGVVVEDVAAAGRRAGEAVAAFVVAGGERGGAAGAELHRGPG
jgi:hypothetical protein